VQLPVYGEVNLANGERLCRDRVSIGQACLLATTDDMRDIVRALEKIREHVGEMAP